MTASYLKMVIFIILYLLVTYAIMTNKKTLRKNIMANDTMIFFLGPLVFFIVALISGNGLLSETFEKNGKRFAWLLSAGALCYFFLTILIISIS